MKRSIWILSVMLSACSQTTSVQQPVVPQQQALDTINFGIDPLWREADTTITIKLASNEPVTSIEIAYSNFSNFSLLDTSQRNDTLRISLRFQPQSLGNHSSQCLVFSKQDTLSKLILLGEATPFERRIGDSYIFADSLGKLDSIWVSALPMTFSTSDSTADVDRFLRSATLEPSGDWKVQPQGLPSPNPLPQDTHGILPVVTHTPSQVNWGYTLLTYSLSSSADMTGTTEFAGGFWFDKTIITMTDRYHLQDRFTDIFINGSFSGNYTSVGFFVTYSYSWTPEGSYGGFTYSPISNSHRLLRFHLQR